jgi:hypothetical protein
VAASRITRQRRLADNRLGAFVSINKISNRAVFPRAKVSSAVGFGIPVNVLALL